MQEPSTSGRDSEAGVTRHAEMYERAELYYAYDLMHKSYTCPFRTVFAATLLNAACFLLMHMPKVRGSADKTGAWRAAPYIQPLLLRASHTVLICIIVAASALVPTT